jgi:hypothetical protein
MIKLLYETPDFHTKFTAIASCEMEIRDEASLDEMLDAYASFLRALGYVVPHGAYLQVIEDEV